jgi:hypothetical protein
MSERQTFRPDDEAAKALAHADRAVAQLAELQAAITAELAALRAERAEIEKQREDLEAFKHALLTAAQQAGAAAADAAMSNHLAREAQAR